MSDHTDLVSRKSLGSRMGSKKRPSISEEPLDSENNDLVEEVSVENDRGFEKGETFVAKTAASAAPRSMNIMERRKKRKGLDKTRHRLDSEKEHPKAKMPSEGAPLADTQSVPSMAATSQPGLHVNVFRDLASADSSVREAAAESLVVELSEVQKAYENQRGKGEEDGALQLEAEKDDGLEDCAPSLRYAIRRLIRGVSSSREVSYLATYSPLPSRNYLLGRLFAYGSLARSGRIVRDWSTNTDTSVIKDFMSHVISLAGKKRYLSEPAVSIILDLVDKLPSQALSTEVLKASGVHDWFKRAAEVGDPDALYLALKLQEKIQVDDEVFGKLLPRPFTSENFFGRDHLLYSADCFKESSFCLPRVHSLWPVVVNLLTLDITHSEDVAIRTTSVKKQKRNRKGSSFEDIAKNIRCFHEVVIERSLLQSSHDRKLLALDVLLLILPKLPVSCIKIVLSSKLVHCLMDVLSNKDSWLYSAAQHFLKELLDLVGDDNGRCVSVITSLQKHSSGRFDSITRTQTVKILVAKFNTVPGCLLFVQDLISLFVDEGPITDEPSDQSQTTDENSDLGSSEDKETLAPGNIDSLKNWVIDIMPRVLKNLKLDSDAKSWPHSEIVKHIEAKFRVQTEITKFLAVQGLFSASLGTEVTSFELQEKFKWPKAAISSSLCKMCIEQLQSLLEDAQRGESSHASTGIEFNDLGSYFVCLLNTLYNIPSVSLYRTLTSEDEKAFKKLLSMESRLSQELLLQVLVCPGEFSEAASELTICCRKAFPAAADDGSSEDEEYDGNNVFKSFCDDITDAGLLQMLRVIKKDLKGPRHPTASSYGDDDEEEDDDDFLGIEEAEEADEVGTDDTVDSDGHADGADELLRPEETNDKVAKKDVDLMGTDKLEAIDEVTKNEELSASDDSDDDMDDDAMFRMDSYIARIFKERKISGSDSAQSQLIPFKLRVLSLLEIYLQKNPGKPQVLMVYSYLAQAYVNSHMTEGGEPLKQRIGGIVQKKVFKAKDYPKSDDIQLHSLEILLEKSLKSASRSRYKTVSTFAQTSTFWLLKVIHSRDFSKSELESVANKFQNILVDYFSNKKSRLKAGFVKEVIRRHSWFGLLLFGFLLEKCGTAKSEFRQIEALDVIDCIIKTCIPTGKGEKDQDDSSKAKFLKKNLPGICELMEKLLTKMPEKQSRRAEVRRFCTRILNTVSMLNLNKAFLKVLKPDARVLFEHQLGEVFHPFKSSS
ncbi:hypothetical protein B296_00017342 [Ensete ventricosum]|uniref:DNA polymerase V n=1 Tax=Ensete ventricosum TaxID=4639 RepID=A0A426ZP20_ENSVE|nr:hypothetical protein B296_00017342 [Ensete ventricosum]